MRPLASACGRHIRDCLHDHNATSGHHPATAFAAPASRPARWFRRVLQVPRLVIAGVRLFRRIGFKSKAIWISTAFLLPLVMALGLLAMAAREQITVTASERAGVEYARPLLNLVAAAQNRRRAAAGNDADLPAMQDKVRAAFADLQAKHTMHGKAMALEEAFEALRKSHDALLKNSAGGLRRCDLHRPQRFHRNGL
jgi:hypothetical protein